MLRRLAIVALLLILPCTAHADGLPGTGSYPLDRMFLFAGCEAGFRSCHTVEVHARYVPGSYHLGQETYITFENFQSVWFDGTTDPYQLYGGSSYQLHAVECYLGGFGYAGPTVAGTLDSDNGGCGRNVSNDWQLNPDATMFARLVFNPSSMDYTTYGVTLHPVTTPEPASFVLLGSGLLMLAGVVRRVH